MMMIMIFGIQIYNKDHIKRQIYYLKYDMFLVPLSLRRFTTLSFVHHKMEPWVEK